MSGRRSLQYSIGLAIVVTCALLYLLYKADQNRGLVESTTNVRLQLDSFLACLTDAETGQRGYLVTNDEMYLEPYDNARARIAKVLKNLLEASAVRTSARDAEVAQLRQLWDTRLSVIDETIRLNRAGRNKEAIDLVNTGLGKKMMDEARERVAKLSLEEQELLRSQQIQHSRFMWLIVLTAIFGYTVPIVLLAGAMSATGRENKYRRMAEDKAQAERERLWVTIKSIGDAVISTDSHGSIDFLNPVAESLTGWPLEDAVGHACAEVFRIVTEETRLEVESPVTKVLREGNVVGLANHTVLIGRNGSEYHINDSAAPIRDSAGNLLGVILVFRDITRQRTDEMVEAERVSVMSTTADVNAALVQSSTQSEMLQRCCSALLQNLGVAVARIWLLKDTESILELRASAGLDPGIEGDTRLPLGQSIIGSIAETRKPYISNSIRDDPKVSEATAGKEMVSFAGFPLIVDDLLIGVISVSSCKVLSRNSLAALSALADGIAVGVVRRAAQEMLKQTNAELASARDSALEASHAKSAFLASTSHELRTPLNAIIGYAEMVQEELKDGARESLQLDIERIEKAGRHLLALINDILDLSKIEAGRMELLVEAFPVKEVVDEVELMVRPLVTKSQNTLSVDCDGACGEMIGDQTKVRQILYNLLSNALKFTENGEVSLTVTRDIAGDDGWICFAISDSGIGMTTEQMATLFQDFSQLDATSTRKYGGTGLGLAISRRFCRMLGGDISVKSEPGKGSTFTARLPVRTEGIPSGIAGGDAVAPDQQFESASSDCLLLVIDDDPTVHDLIRRTVQKEGVRVASAYNGTSGLEMARQFKPKAITLDVVMPDLDGWSVLSTLKSDAALSDIPVVLLSILDDRNLGFTLGATEYLTKPIQRDRLLKILQEAGCNPPKCNVLVVDDDEDARTMASRLLASHGCEMCSAIDGVEALEKLESFTPDLILLDLMMPRMDGFEFLEVRAGIARLRAIPVVVLTAKELNASDRSRLQVAVDRVLQKGLYTREELLAIVKEHARKKTKVQ